MTIIRILSSLIHYQSFMFVKYTLHLIKHKYQNWDKVCYSSGQNLHGYESFGIQLKYLAEHDLNARFIRGIDKTLCLVDQ